MVAAGVVAVKTAKAAGRAYERAYIEPQKAALAVTEANIERQGQRKRALEEKKQAIADGSSYEDASITTPSYADFIAAVKAGMSQRVKRFLQAGAGRYVNQNDKDGYTPLMRAAEEGNLKIAKALLDAGATKSTQSNGNGKWWNSWTAYHFAEKHHRNNRELLALLRP